MSVVHHEKANKKSKQKKKLNIHVYSVYAHKTILISFIYIILTQSEIKSSLLASIIPCNFHVVLLAIFKMLYLNRSATFMCCTILGSFQEFNTLYWVQCNGIYAIYYD